MKASIGQAWTETKESFRLDGRLILLVAVALIVLPGTLADLATPPAAPGEPAPTGWWNILSIAALIIGLIAQLAIARIALGPATTVGNAIGEGARRAPVYILAMLLWLLPFILLFSPVALAVQENPQSPPPWALLVGTLVLIAFLFVGVRLLLTTAIAVAEPIGPVAMLKRSWNLSRGNWWRLLVAILLLLLLAVLLLVGVGGAFGSVVILLLGQPEQWSVGDLLITLFNQLVGGAITAVFVVLIARLYAQLAGGRDEPVSVPHAP